MIWMRVVGPALAPDTRILANSSALGWYMHSCGTNLLPSRGLAGT